MRSSYNSKIGDGDISDIGSTVTGAIYHLGHSSTSRIIENIPSNTTTWRGALNTIWTAFSSLNWEDKLNSYICIDLLGKLSLTVHNSSLARFFLITPVAGDATYGNYINVTYADLRSNGDSAWRELVIGSKSSNTTAATTQTCNTSLQLCVGF